MQYSLRGAPFDRLPATATLSEGLAHEQDESIVPVTLSNVPLHARRPAIGAATRKFPLAISEALQIEPDFPARLPAAEMYVIVAFSPLEKYFHVYKKVKKLKI